MAVTSDVLYNFLRNHYPDYERRLSLHSDHLYIQHKKCGTELKIKSPELLGISIDTYVHAIIVRTLNSHDDLCDGTVQVSPKDVKLKKAALPSLTPKRNITLE